MPRTLLLDLDGTLVDTVPDLASALNRLMAHRGLSPFPSAEVTAMVGDGVAALVAKAFKARGAVQDDDAVGAFTADYEAHVAVASRLYPAVTETLSALAGTGWTLAVCTNKPVQAARSLLSALGLTPLIAAVGGGDSFAVRKPDPAHLRETLALAGGRADQAVMLGDHRNDVAAARAAGIPSIFAAWGYGPLAMAEGSTAVAHDMTEAAGWADRLLA